METTAEAVAETTIEAVTEATIKAAMGPASSPSAYTSSKYIEYSGGR